MVAVSTLKRLCAQLGAQTGNELFLQVRAWLQPGGYLLCFGTIMLKMWRVYYIFHNPSAKKKRKVYTHVHVDVCVCLYVYIFTTQHLNVHVHVYAGTQGLDAVFGCPGDVWCICSDHDWSIHSG